VTDIRDCLHAWLTRQLSPAAMDWLNTQSKAIVQGDRRTLFLSFGMASRKIGKAELQLSAADLAVAQTIRPRWQPRGWVLDQCARTLFVLQFPTETADACVTLLDQLFAAGEMHELVALYQALPLYPYPEAHRLRCAEGIRSNIRGVFAAVAHHNPYPSEMLSDDAWNQMILKCLFVGLPLDPVVGLDERTSPRLSDMLLDYAEERAAARRAISPELWRALGASVPERGVRALQKRAEESSSRAEQFAAALALDRVATSSQPTASMAANAMAALPIEVTQPVTSGNVSWSDVLQLHLHETADASHSNPSDTAPT
jgi:hypothetical protein